MALRSSHSRPRSPGNPLRGVNQSERPIRPALGGRLMEGRREETEEQCWGPELKPWSWCWGPGTQDS